MVEEAVGVSADGTMLILKSPNKRWKITVDDTGALQTEEVVSE